MKFIYLAITTITLLNCFSPQVYAQGSLDPDNNMNSLSATHDVFAQVDPLKNKFDSPAAIISELLPYILTFAGLILFAMLIMGGFTMMTATTDPKKAEAGKERITTAIIGFVIIFAAYWISQIIEIIFGVSILK